MKKLGIFVGEDNWTFFHEIHADLSKSYQVSVFERQAVRVPFFSGRINHYWFARRMRSLLQNNEVCFFEWASDLLTVASYMPKRCKIVTRLHSFELYEWATKVNWDAVDSVIVLSEAMKSAFSLQYPDHKHKLVVIHNGCSLSKFQPIKKQAFHFTLGMLGHITPIKRIYETILMVYGLLRQGNTVKLRIGGEPAGDYRYFMAVKRLIEKLGLQEQVVFDGYISDTPSWLNGVDIYISNSYWEGQQVALLEAMAMGCYCLAHFWAGAEEMLPPENLYITEADLQSKIIEYGSKSNEEKHILQTRLQTLAREKFDIEITKRQIRQVIDAL